MQSAQRRKEQNTHVSDDTKSVRERYIREAEIDIMTRQGNWNIWIAELCK